MIYGQMKTKCETANKGLMADRKRYFIIEHYWIDMRENHKRKEETGEGKVSR